MAAFYRRFETEVIAAEACGVSFVNETILQDEIETVMNDLKVNALKSFKENNTDKSQAAKDAVKAVKVTDAKREEIK